MSARDVPDRGDHHGDGQAAGERDADESEATVDVLGLRARDRGSEDLRHGQNRARAREDEEDGDRCPGGVGDQQKQSNQE